MTELDLPASTITSRTKQEPCQFVRGDIRALAGARFVSERHAAQQQHILSWQEKRSPAVDPIFSCARTGIVRKTEDRRRHEIHRFAAEDAHRPASLRGRCRRGLVQNGRPEGGVARQDRTAQHADGLGGRRAVVGRRGLIRSAVRRGSPVSKAIVERSGSIGSENVVRRNERHGRGTGIEYGCRRSTGDLSAQVSPGFVTGGRLRLVSWQIGRGGTRQWVRQWRRSR